MFIPVVFELVNYNIFCNTQITTYVSSFIGGIRPSKKKIITTMKSISAVLGSSLLLVGMMQQAHAVSNVTEDSYMVFYYADESYDGTFACANGFTLHLQAGDESSWMPGFTTSDDLPFCSKYSSDAVTFCPSSEFWAQKSHYLPSTREHVDTDAWVHGCAAKFGDVSTCCGYHKPNSTNCGDAGYCPKPAELDFEGTTSTTFCHVPWEGMCNGNGQCQVEISADGNSQTEVCECTNGFTGDTCDIAPACLSTDTEIYPTWVDITTCLPICGKGRYKVQKNTPAEEFYYCPTQFQNVTCDDQDCDTADGLEVFATTTQETDLNNFVGSKGDFDNQFDVDTIVAALTTIDDYLGRNSGADLGSTYSNLAESLQEARTLLGTGVTIQGGYNNTQQMLNAVEAYIGMISDKAAFEAVFGAGTTLTEATKLVNDSAHAAASDNDLRAFVGYDIQELLPEDTIIDSVIANVERLGRAGVGNALTEFIDEFGDITVAEATVQLNRSKVSTERAGACEYLPEPIEPNNCIGNCGEGKKTIRWIPKPGQPGYCQEVTETIACDLPLPCPLTFHDGQMVPNEVSAAPCVYTSWSDWSMCSSTEIPGAPRGFRFRMRHLKEGKESKCTSVVHTEICNPQTGERITNPDEFFVPHPTKSSGLLSSGSVRTNGMPRNQFVGDSNVCHTSNTNYIVAIVISSISLVLLMILSVMTCMGWASLTNKPDALLGESDRAPATTRSSARNMPAGAFRAMPIGRHLPRI